ncbi:hypothetical protein GCWU000324_00061 [Kingella oralis ATCC 51147]|uniref:Uncharacterized protein n=1 Tax=Kingella oralis ATCC 51147 TaxID=629741 RepID=C4GEH5_9NEIS|nr:hypothetical protein GCWU000324_00061 [Kingella oralis ATCC 51147]
MVCNLLNTKRKNFSVFSGCLNFSLYSLTKNKLKCQVFTNFALN